MSWGRLRLLTEIDILCRAGVVHGVGDEVERVWIVQVEWRRRSRTPVGSVKAQRERKSESQRVARARDNERQK